MKKYFKLTLSLILVLAMVLQLSAVAFAANIGLINHETNELNVTATVAVRGLSAEAKLVTAVYDASGSVVDYDVSESAENAKDAFLKTTVEKEAETDTVKSFIWNTDDKATPLTVAADLAVATEADVEIYFDGVPFATAAGEALNFSKDTYTVKLSDTDADGDVAIPKVTYKVKDSSIDVDVATDYEAMQSVITIGSGERIVDSRSVTNPNGSGAATTKVYYSRESEEVITVNYISDELLTTDFIEGGVAGTNGGTIKPKYDHVISYANAGKVSFEITGLTYRSAAIVIEPKNAGADKNTVLYQDGTPITWTRDTGVVSDYDYDEAYANNKYAEPFVESRATYGMLSAYQGMAESNVINPNNTTVNNAQSVVHTGYPIKVYNKANGADTAVYIPVYDNFHVTDNYMITGARITNGGSREPVCGGVAFSAIESAYAGCNYISIPSASMPLGAGVTTVFEFYVDEPVNVHVLSTATGIITATGDGTYTEPTAATNKHTAAYINTSEPVALAYLIKTGVMDITDAVPYGSTTSLDFTVDGTKYYYVRAYKLRKRALILDGKLTSFTLTPEDLVKYGIGALKDGTSTTYNIIPVEEIVLKIKTVEEAPVALVTDVARPTETVTYNGAAINFNDKNLPLPVPEIFDAEDTNQSIAMDRLGLKDTSRFNGTGSISSYPGSYDLDDAIFLQSNIKYADGSAGAIACMYNNYTSTTNSKPGTFEENYTPRPLYTFKVNRPAEIIVFCGDVHPGLAADGYEFTFLDVADSLRYTYSGSTIRNLRYVYTKEVQPGTITMKTPGNSGLYVVFVKELNK